MFSDHGSSVGYERTHNNYQPAGFPQNNMYSKWGGGGGGGGYAPSRVSCGELRPRDTGRIVELAGRLHKLSRDRFVQLKDLDGITQLVVPPERTDLQKRFQRMPLNSFLAVMGEVHRRPNRGHNEKMSTGEIEVIVGDILMVRVNKIEGKSQAVMVGSSREPPSDDNPPKITSEEYHKFQGLLQQLKERKYTCGDLCHKINQGVNLLCWVEKSSKKFISLMDGYGKIQAVVPSNRDDIVAIADNLTSQAVVVAAGKVVDRPKSQINPSAINGHIELHIETLEWPMFDLNEIKDSEALESFPETVSSVNQLTGRTHTCGELRAAHAGQRVVLCGRLQFVRLAKFVLLRDAYGLTQCVLSQPGTESEITNIPLESVVKIEGMVAMRPPSMVNEDLTTGEVEVIIKTLVILSVAKTLPYKMKTQDKPGEQTRLQFRYMDLRSKEMQNNLRLRSTLLQNMRKFFIENHQFVEVDTPTLSCRPLGVTKSLRVQAENMSEEYWLVGEPLLYSQLLMAGEVDRYFHLARRYSCELEEGQVEKTWLHAGMCYTDRDNFIHLLEQLLRATLPTTMAPPPFVRITYRDALRTYGTARPDVSFDLKFRNLTSVMDIGNAQNINNFGAYAIIYPDLVGPFSEDMKRLLVKIKANNLKTTIVFDLKELNPAVESNLRKHMELAVTAPYIVAYGDDEESCLRLGEIRNLLANELSRKNLLHRNKSVKPVWIVDLPMFSAGEPGAFRPSYSTFATPHPDDVALLDTDPKQVRAVAYSLVMNGQRLAEGCLRNNVPAMLGKQLQLTDLDDSITSRLLQALDSGCPPHAEISIDIDELVAMACSAVSIRDVIAFPKSSNGEDLLFKNSAHEVDLDCSEPKAKVKRFI